MHRLVLAMAAYQGHYQLVAFDAAGDAVGEVQLVIVADFNTVEVVEPVDNLVEELLFGIVGLSEPTSLTRNGRNNDTIRDLMKPLVYFHVKHRP